MLVRPDRISRPFPDFESPMPRRLPPPSARDRILEPRLEGLEENPVFRWGRPGDGPRKSNGSLWALTPILYPIASLALLFGATVGGFPLVAAGFALIGIAAWLQIARPWRARRTDSFSGHSLEDWADAVAVGISADTIARGLWGRSRTESRGFRSWLEDDPRHFAFAAGFVVLLLVIGAMYGRTTLPGVSPLVGLGAFLLLLTPIALFGVAYDRETSVEPWCAARSLRGGLVQNASGLSGDFAMAIPPDRPADLADTLRRHLRRKTMVAVAYGLGAIVLFVVWGVGAAKYLPQGSAKVLGVAIFPVSFLAGWMVGRYRAWTARSARDIEYELLVAAIQGGMDLACRAVHGPDAVTRGRELGRRRSRLR